MFADLHNQSAQTWGSMYVEIGVGIGPETLSTLGWIREAAVVKVGS
jgi:hypothetical protein